MEQRQKKKKIKFLVFFLPRIVSGDEKFNAILNECEEMLYFVLWLAFVPAHYFLLLLVPYR